MPQLDFDGANSKVSADKIQGQSGTTVTVPTGHKIAGTDADSITINGVNAVAVAPSTSGNVLTSTGSAWASSTPAAAGFTLLGAKIATTSGTSISITGIPADVSMVILGFMGVSYATYLIDLNIQLGTASGLVTSGYVSGSVKLRSGGTWDTTSIDQVNTTGNFIVRGPDANSATNSWNGQMIFTRMDSSTDAWVASHSLYSHHYRENTGGGHHPDLGGALTQINLSVGGWAFDGGHINVNYI